MLIECKLQREGGSVVTIGEETYHFKPQGGQKHVATVQDPAHVTILLGIPEAYAVCDSEEKDGADDERTALVAAYEEKFGKKPHHKLSADKIREALEA